MPAGAQSQKRSTWNTSLADAEARKEGIEHRFGARRAGDPIERGARATKAFGHDQRIGIADDPCKLAMRLTAQIPLATIEHGDRKRVVVGMSEAVRVDLDGSRRFNITDY